MNKSNLNPVVFTRPGAKLSVKTISISPVGGFLFSAGFVHEEKLQEYSHCILGYDASASAICFQFLKDDKAEGSIKVTHREPGNSSIQSSSFFRFNKLNLSEFAGKYPIHKESIPRRGSHIAIQHNIELIPMAVCHCSSQCNN